MASRSEITKDLKALIGKGDIRDAYSKFEELPIVDQLAISFTPGIGDALTAYEIGEFGTRAGENIQKGDLLGGLGYGALSALGVASFIPILRFIRAKKAVQPLAKSEPKILEDSTKIKEPVDAEIIPDFIQKDLNDLVYPNTSGLISPTRKFINDQVGNKLPETATVEKYISLLKKTGRGSKVSEGELRSLRVLDEVGGVHPQLKKQFGNKVIGIEELDQYLKKNQEGLFNFEVVPKDSRHMPGISEDAAEAIYPAPSAASKGEMQKVYQIRNLEDLRLNRDISTTNHYPDYDNVFAFDGVTDLFLNPRLDPNTGGGIFTNPGVRRTVSRIQSEYSKMLSKLVQRSGNKVFTNKEDIIQLKNKAKEINQQLNQSTYLRIAVQEKRNLLKTLEKGSPEFKKTTLEISSLNQDLKKITKDYADNSKFVSEYKMPTSFKNPHLKEDIKQFYKREFYSPDRLISTVPDMSENLLKFVRASKEIKNPTFKGVSGNKILKEPISFKGSDKIRRGPFDDKAIAKTEIPTVRENIAAAAKDPKIKELVFTSGEGSRIRDGGGGFTYDFYDNRVFKQIEKVLKELDMEDNLIGKQLDSGSFAEGTYIKIDDALRKAIDDKGISAFKDGGEAEDPRISKQMGFDELDEIETFLNKSNIPFDYDKEGRLTTETGYKFKARSGYTTEKLANKLNEISIGSVFKGSENPRLGYYGRTGTYKPDNREIYARESILGIERAKKESIELGYENALAHEYLHDVISQTGYLDSLKNIEFPPKITNHLNVNYDADKAGPYFFSGEASKKLANMGPIGANLIEEVLATAVAHNFEPQFIPGKSIPEKNANLLSNLRFRLGKVNLSDSFEQAIIDDLPFLVDHFSDYIDKYKINTKPSEEILNTSEPLNYK